jgi:Plasmid pRiA4b ORF-3-like protein
MSRSSARSIVRVKIKLLHTRFEIVRVVDLSSRVRLDEMHHLIQAVMPWNNSHAHHFLGGERRWALPSSDQEDFGIQISDERIATIGAAFEIAGNEPLIYDYDPGDGWLHALTLEAVTAPDPETDYPLLIEAVGACPPDDVGGVGGYRQFVAAMTDPDAPDHKRLRRWYGRPFDPDHVDVPMIRQRLTELKHRWSSRPS